MARPEGRETSEKFEQGRSVNRVGRLRLLGQIVGRLDAWLALLCALGLPFPAMAAEPYDCAPEPETTQAHYGYFFDGPNCTITSGDIDVLRFSAKIGERVLIHAVDQSGSGLHNVCITLLDPFGVPTPNGAMTCGNVTVQITDDIGTDGTHSILVEEAGASSIGFGLTLERLAPQPSPFAPVICNGCSENDAIDGGGDLDPRIFTGAAGDVVAIQATDLSGSGLHSFCVTLFDSAGLPTANGFETCADVTAVINETLPSPGVYTILVREAGQSFPTYNLTYQCLVGTCPAFDSPSVTPSMANVDFGQVEIGTSSPTVQISLMGSSGDIDAAIGEMALSGADADEFEIQNDQCSHVTLSDGESCTFDLVFSPMTLGNLVGAVDIVTNDQQNLLLTIPLTGEGIDAPLTCRGVPVTMQGTGGADLLIGTAGVDIIHALGGNDIVYGMQGNDIICAGDGRDVVLGGTGNDTLLGEGGPDVMFGDEGNDILNGDQGTDYLNGGAGDDVLAGASGFDTCDGGTEVTADTETNCENILNIP